MLKKIRNSIDNRKDTHFFLNIQIFYNKRKTFCLTLWFDPPPLSYAILMLAPDPPPPPVGA